jgi:uncharacterized protein
MKKLTRILMILLCFGWIFLPLAHTFAYDISDGSYVIDDADLLSDSEERELETRIAELRLKHKFDIVLVTNPSTNGQSAMAYADDYFDYNGYGYGANRDGLLFLVTFYDDEGYRTFWTSTSGCGIDAFTDYGLEQINDKIQSYLSSGDYYDAFDTYLNLCDEFLLEYEKGTPYDNSHPRYTLAAKGGVLGTAGVLGAIISSITVGVMKGKLSNKRRASKADEYLDWGDVRLSQRADIFLYSTTRTRHIERNRSSGSRGGGSSVHFSSSGRSHGGGGGHF